MSIIIVSGALKPTIDLKALPIDSNILGVCKRDDTQRYQVPSSVALKNSMTTRHQHMKTLCKCNKHSLQYTKSGMRE